MSNTTFYSINYASEVDKPWIASINCYNQDQGEAGGGRTATMRFFADPTAVPADETVDGIPVVNYPLSRFDSVVAILRTERDIEVNFSSGGPDNERGFGISSFSPTGLWA